MHRPYQSLPAGTVVRSPRVPALTVLSIVALTVLAGCSGDSVVAPTTDGGDQGGGMSQTPAGMADVPLRQLAARHGLAIGNAVRDRFQFIAGTEQYQAIVEREFDIVTPEGAGKWLFLRPDEQSFDFSDLDRLVTFAEANDMAVHGHPLLWHRLNPDWLETVPAERMQQVVTDHVTEVVTRYRGQIEAWDVVNEALAEQGPELREDSVFFQALGEDYIRIAHDAAQAADPDVELIYNDFEVGWPTPKSEGFFALAERLQQQGTRLDGLGFQMHIEHDFAHAEGFSTNMQRVADLGLDVWITEFDVGALVPEQFPAQAVVYQDILERCLMQPACGHFQIWGLTDNLSFRPDKFPLPFDANFQPKEAFFALRLALSAEPVHVESCTLDGFIVERGSIRPNSSPGVSAAPVATCPGVRLGPGYTTLRVRYANDSTHTPALVINAGDDVAIARVDLPPVMPDSDGVFRTIDVVTAARPTGNATVTLELEGVGDGVSIDALLFNDPLEPVIAPSTGEPG